MPDLPIWDPDKLLPQPTIIDLDTSQSPSPWVKVVPAVHTVSQEFVEQMAKEFGSITISRHEDNSLSFEREVISGPTRYRYSATCFNEVRVKGQSKAWLWECIAIGSSLDIAVKTLHAELTRWLPTILGSLTMDAQPLVPVQTYIHWRFNSKTWLSDALDVSHTI